MKLKQRIAMLLLVTIYMSYVLSTGAVGQVYYDGTASGWAVQEIQEAEKLGLTYSNIMGKFTTPITREEFCIIVIKLYEKLSNKTVTAAQSPFSDTSNSEIIKANQLGIVLGTGNGKFSPNANIKRQELSVMIYRALTKALPNADMTEQSTETITDESLIADWAKTQIRFCLKKKIIQGIGGGKADPLGNTTREQAIAIIKRTYESFSQDSGDNIITDKDKFDIPGLSNENSIKLKALRDAALDGKGTAIVVSETQSDQRSKFNKIDFNNRLVSPKFDTKVKLYAAIKDTKPSALPQNGNLQGQYTDSADGCFININGNHKRYFAFDNLAQGAEIVVWQVSKVPFNGYPNKWKTPGGLLASGEVPVSAREFVVDFGLYDIDTIKSLAMNTNRVMAMGKDTNKSNNNILGSKIEKNTGALISDIDVNKVIRPSLSLLGLSKPDKIPRSQRDFYVRAVPVNSAGECIGDPGKGIHVVYGKTIVSSQATSSATTSFELWTLENSGQSPIGTPEFRNYFKKQGETTLAVYGTEVGTWFQWRELDSKASSVVFQVSTKPLPNVPNNWETPEGLVHSDTYTDLSKDIPSYYNTVNAKEIIFSNFAPKLQPEQQVEYYVRAVGLVDSKDHPGTIQPVFSNTIKTIYKMPKPIKILTPKTIMVPANSPDITGFSYTPINWEDYEYLSYYMVSRKPQPSEVTFTVANKNTGMVLLPYATAKFFGISDAQYNQTLETMLPVGAVIKVVPKDEDKSWWGDLWDSIYNFFKSIVNTLASIVNWVSEQYENLKTTVVSAVASCIAVVNSDWKDEIEAGLKAMLETGLAAMGIPPTIPNFDKLCDEGLDYAIKTALQEAGVPADELSVAAAKEVAGIVGDEIKKSGSHGSPNPLGNCPFLRLDPGHQYQPASIKFTLTNNSNISTAIIKNAISPTGYVNLSVWSGNYPSYPVFHNKSVAIPALQPGESTTVVIYLEEYHDAPYPNGDFALSSDFRDAYWGDGYYKDPYGKFTEYKPTHFDIGLGFNVPDDVMKEAQRLGLDNIPNKENYILSYQYDGKYKSLSFEGKPCDYKY